MRDVLAGGILITTDVTVPVLRKAALSRRRRPARARTEQRRASPAPAVAVQPGQLASPLMRFGFPSLALH